jgi:hypothetical protein
MHLETRRKGRRARYYLAHSYRRGKRVLKARVFLGSGLSPEDIDRRRSLAERSSRPASRRPLPSGTR